jgi:putative endonuclease
MIRCYDGTLYTGITTDVSRRFAEHRQAGAKASRYLKGRGPIELILALRVGDRSRALRLEHRIKRLSRAKKEALIEDPQRIRHWKN